MEMPRFSVELLVAQRVIGSVNNEREGYLEGFNQRVRIDLDGDGCGGLGYRGNDRKAGSGRIRIEIAEGLDVARIEADFLLRLAQGGDGRALVPRLDLASRTGDLSGIKPARPSSFACE